MITKPNKEGKTPEALAIEGNYTELIKFLKSKNEDKTKIIYDELENWTVTDTSKNNNIKSKKKKKKRNNKKLSKTINYSRTSSSEDEKVVYADKILNINPIKNSKEIEQIDENEFQVIERGKKARSKVQNNVKDMKKPMYYTSVKNQKNDEQYNLRAKNNYNYNYNEKQNNQYKPEQENINWDYNSNDHNNFESDE